MIPAPGDEFMALVMTGMMTIMTVTITVMMMIEGMGSPSIDVLRLAKWDDCRY